jgi:hypothetical protein
MFYSEFHNEENKDKFYNKETNKDGIKIIGIYKILNTVNDIAYIGKSTNIYERWRNHCVDLNSNTHKNKNLQTDFDWFNFEVFDFQIIELLIEKDSYKLSYRELDNIYSYPTEIYNIKSEREEMIYKLAKALDFAGIDFSLFYRIKDTFMDIAIMDEGKVKKVLDIHTKRTKQGIVNKRSNYCEELGIEFYSYNQNNLPSKKKIIEDCKI